MTTTELIEQIKAQALELPKHERELLARELFAAGEALADLDDDADGVDTQLDAVITRRLASVRDGSAKLVSRDEFFARVRTKIAAQ
jgi:hypothetical protein